MAPRTPTTNNLNQQQHKNVLHCSKKLREYLNHTQDLNEQKVTVENPSIINCTTKSQGFKVRSPRFMFSHYTV